MDYQIEIRDIEPIRVAFMKYKGVVAEANKVFPNVFKSIQGKSNAAPFICYYVVDQKSKVGEMELCVPTAETPSGNGITVKELPRIKAVCATHIGAYETMNYAYEAIERYARENRLTLQHPFREVYIKGPGMFLKGNPKKYITEILFPIKEVQ
ncbi:GyrI-like domain-containing protein [Clostridium estertheticum]|uniref:GyrI-like domain-containing protein n=1 Tax=Clostridium estertheticum TaxID=238834 RepID=UPI001CF3C7C4|nr:GyrI-like domain-containing protein [Clostridium estertheticum]MCB2307299.1 GyrI-like domain-containing protein [Clostridium estertheticum]MCB2344949.1 GyrI-like domain-containing protein [Clostridium estertheticum]MCB2349889.1 GyrI-like domain-containing protein [Clostridium estertheticum]WAG48188.1 GyrI-like domain-containing protein [Clostridium estertheticum]